MNCNRINNICRDVDDYSNKHENIISLSKSECNAIREEYAHYEDLRAVSIEALKIVQKKRGWISDNVIVLIAKMLCIPIADLEGVATFYNQIFRQPVGRNIVRYCDSVVCHIFGYEEIKRVLINKLGITAGNTTIDNRFTLLPMCCVGACDKAPVIMINNDMYYHIIPEKIIQLLECYL